MWYCRNIRVIGIYGKAMVLIVWVGMTLAHMVVVGMVLLGMALVRMVWADRVMFALCFRYGTLCYGSFGLAW